VGSYDKERSKETLWNFMLEKAKEYHSQENTITEKTSPETSNSDASDIVGQTSSLDNAIEELKKMSSSSLTSISNQPNPSGKIVHLKDDTFEKVNHRRRNP